MSLACEDQPREPGTSTDQGLVGGTQVPAGQLDATVLIENWCTAVKVGPRHLLTADHCVVEEHVSVLRAGFASGATLRFTSDKVVPANGWGVSWQARTIARTLRLPRNAGLNFAAPDMVDVAAIEVTADLPPPYARVDVAPVPVGTSLLINGYGCETNADPGHIYRDGRRSKSAAFPVSEIVGPLLAMRTRADFDSCPGDSGAPVYLAADTTRVAAIHSSRGATTQRAFQVRLDNDVITYGGHPVRVGDWLDAILDGNVASRACRAFPATSLSACGPMLHHLEATFGEARLGLPIGTAGGADFVDGGVLVTGHQLFQRGWLLLTPEIPGEVRLHKFGSAAAARLGVATGFGDPARGPGGRCEYLGPNPAAGQANWVCDDILDAWHGRCVESDGAAGCSAAESEAMWGWPITGAMTMDVAGPRTVQWFDRARLERHPEATAPELRVQPGPMGCAMLALPALGC